MELHGDFLDLDLSFSPQNIKQIRVIAVEHLHWALSSVSKAACRSSEAPIQHAAFFLGWFWEDLLAQI